MSGGEPLGRDFFTQDPARCARAMVGCELVWNDCAGIIVETEAYFARNDEACHTFMRPSSRAFVAANPPGTAYVYFNYGMYWLLNVLLKGEEDGFVLIRAVEPTRGIDQMRQRRRQEKLTALCSGPGKLCQAFSITGEDHGRDLCERSDVGFRTGLPDADVHDDVRVGISKAAHHPWRYLLRESPYVSVPHGRASKPRPRKLKT